MKVVGRAAMRYRVTFKICYYIYMSKQSKNGAKLDFVGQREGEELLFVFRRHMVAMRKGFYLLLVPLLITSLPILIWSSTIEDVKLFFLPLAGFVIGLIMFSYHLMIWYFTIYIVTDQRIRQITRRGLFGKDVVELKLSKIHNISYNIPGLSGELFKYGTIIIRTFAGDLVIHNVDHPEGVYNKLQDAVNRSVGKNDYEEDVE